MKTMLTLNKDRDTKTYNKVFLTQLLAQQTILNATSGTTDNFERNFWHNRQL